MASFCNTSQLLGDSASDICYVRSTTHAGRAVFAARDVPLGTPILDTSEVVVSVVLREYRREVCGYCFAYNNGNALPLRDTSVGFAFCSAVCQIRWRETNGAVGIEACMAVEALAKRRPHMKPAMVVANTSEARPGCVETEKRWRAVSKKADKIRAARMGGDKHGHKEMQRALLAPLSPTILALYLAGTLLRHGEPKRWSRFAALAQHGAPYATMADLTSHTDSYLQLLSVLPAALIDACTTETVHTLSTREAVNSFGIRSLDDDGSEFMGYAVWPAASYFNHSCRPNVDKRRVGRSWVFCTARDVRAGEELNITYLGGEEDMPREARRARLEAHWHFFCLCERCYAIPTGS